MHWFCHILKWIRHRYTCVPHPEPSSLLPPHFREVFNYYLLKYFLMAFLFVFFFWDFYDSNVGVFDIVPEVSEVIFISFNSFFFFPFCFISTILSSTSLILSSASVIRSLQSVFHLIYCIIHYLLTLFYFFQVLVKHFLHLLNPCLQAIYLWFHFDFKILDQFHYHYSEFFIR